MGGNVAAPLIPDGFDFTDPDLYAARLPVEEFALLRRTAPVWWNAQTDAAPRASTTAASGWSAATRT